MFSRATTCLLLTLVLIIMAVPALADGDPPPVVGDGNIHPWDNNDGGRASSGPYIVNTGWMWLGLRSSTGLVVLPRKDVSQTMKSYGSKSDKSLRNREVQVATRTR